MTYFLPIMIVFTVWATGFAQSHLVIANGADTLSIPLQSRSQQACMDTAHIQRLQFLFRMQELDRVVRDSLIAALDRRDSTLVASMLAWKHQTELLQAKDENWKQSWQELMEQNSHCAQQLQEAAATPPPPPERPTFTQRLQLIGGSFLVGFMAAWLLIGP